VGSGLGSIQKMWDPLLISATVEASNFKFCTQQIVGVLSQQNSPNSRIHDWDAILCI